MNLPDDPNNWDPSMTDEQIIATFTPLEHQFYQWQVVGEDEARRLGEDYVFNHHQFYDRLEEKFPNQNAEQAFHRFVDKWHGAAYRRMRHSITPEVFYERLRTTNCKDKTSLGETSLWMQVNNVQDLFFGESSFGGTTTYYGLQTGPQYLFPDTPYGKTIDPTNPDILKHTVMAIDIDIDDSRLPTTTSQLTLNLPQDPNKRRRQNVSSGEESAISVRSADSDDFLDKKPFVFFQVGVLASCTAREWQKGLTGVDNDSYEPDWEETGYGVVVRLDSNGYPTGAVYIVYNYQEQATPAVSNDPNQPAFWQERKWRDVQNHELSHIRRLYPGCNQKFFLAKIADTLTDLKEDGRFDVQVVSEQRKSIVLAKTVGILQKIIPNEIMAEVRSEEHKRPRGEMDMDVDE